MMHSSKEEEPMQEKKDPYHMTGEELQKEIELQEKKSNGFIADLFQAAVEIIMEILDGAN